MAPNHSLGDVLASWAGGDGGKAAVAATIESIAKASVRVGELIADGELAGSLNRAVGENVDGDTQKALDVQANELFIEALRQAPVGVLGSEEESEPLVLGDGPLVVTLDPLDGSSNIETNVSVGSIFGIYSRLEGAQPLASVLQPGDAQLASGFVIYGPQTTLVLTLRNGTRVFTLSRKARTFWCTRPRVALPVSKAEYAINASNARHWTAPVAEYIAECQAGAEGPLGKNYNTRWVASLVAEAYRILMRGGVFLYPQDRRPGYEKGRLRLVYEANPVALLVEQAGGQAIDGQERILSLQPGELHERVPLIFGSPEQVERIRNKG